jgi:hypothetical protein
MSFSMTTQQIRDGSKLVTRRLAWLKLVGKSGILLQGVVKGMGLKKGEHVEKIRVIRLVEARREPLRRMIDDLDYGWCEVSLEGFPDMHPANFVTWFCKGHHCTPDRMITRIEFEYVEGEDERRIAVHG